MLFTAERGKIVCIYLQWALLEELLSVHISWVEASKHRANCGGGLCVPCPLTSLTHPYMRGLETVWIFLRMHCLLLFFPFLHSTNELEAPPEVGEHSKNVLTSDLGFVWPEQSVWLVIHGSCWLQGVAQCALWVFFTHFGRAAGSCISLQWLLHLYFQFPLRESSVCHRQPFPWPLILPAWLIDWAPMLHRFGS